ncbi:MAG: DUF4129 domain-containing protein [Acidobacteriaceae bacterium]
MRRCFHLSFVLLPALLLLSSAQARGLDHVSLQQYRAHLQNLQALAASCESTPSACDPKAVGSDEQVQIQGLGVGANVNSFQAHYGWFRDALTSAKKSDAKPRMEAMRAAQARLDEELRHASTPARDDFSTARKKADTILGNPEFATVQEASLWEQFWAHVETWLDKIFGGVAHFGKRSPWIGPLMEWGLLGIALLALALWVIRVMQRQRLGVRMDSARQMEPWEEAARNWRELAEQQAAQGAWRDAVHCLYWASIAALEGRSLWAPNRSRTPREYVRLLQPGSQRWTLLRQQTQGFERVWYGLREAARHDYESALALHEELRAA